VAERGGKGRKPTQPETPAARLSSRPGPPGTESTRPRPSSPRQSDFKGLLSKDAGRYSRYDPPVTAGLSVPERTLLAKLHEQAPRLARLIAGSVDTAQTRDALRELDMLLNGKRDSKSPRR
jgi:hypothetical protein